MAETGLDTQCVAVVGVVVVVHLVVCMGGQEVVGFVLLVVGVVVAVAVDQDDFGGKAVGTCETACGS